MKQTHFEVDGMKSERGVRSNTRHGNGEPARGRQIKINMADFLWGLGYGFKRLCCVFQ